MKKRLFTVLLMVALSASLFAGEGAQLVLQTNDGREIRYWIRKHFV